MLKLGYKSDILNINMDSLRKKPLQTPSLRKNLSIDIQRQKIQKKRPDQIKPQIPKNKKESPDIFSKKKEGRKISGRFLNIFKKITLFSIFLILFSILISGGYLVYKLNIFSEKISTGTASAQKTPIFETLSDLSRLASEERTSLKGEEKQRINILLLGMAGKGKPGGELTDTIMIASIDTQNNKVALLSLPRDLYATVPELDYSAKINSLYKYGLSNDKDIEPLKKTIEAITDLSINYYLIVNFSGFEEFIDDIGGINVNVERDIYDPAYPGPNYSYETFELKKGFHTLDGATALKYARERHDDPEGDFGRAKRQQQVIQSAKNKIFSTKTMLNPFAVSKMLYTLGDNIQTDITLEEMDSFIKLTKNLDTQNINNAVVDAWKEDSLLKVSHIFYENSRAFILVPSIGNYSEIQDLAKNIFDLKIIEKRKIEIKNENPSIALIDKTGNYSTYSKLEKMLKRKLAFENTKKLNLDTEFSSDKTTIFDLSGNRKPFSLDELIKKIPATLNQENSALSIGLKEDTAKYDIVVILGKDLNEIYRYDEDSIEDLQKSEANQEIPMMKN